MRGSSIVKGQQVDPAKLKRAKELRRDMTPAEKVLWQHVRGNKLAGYHFRRQQVIAGFIVDFYCDAAKLVVEIDGEIHDYNQEMDTDRENVLKINQLRILRIKNKEIFDNLPKALERILTACQQHT